MIKKLSTFHPIAKAFPLLLLAQLLSITSLYGQHFNEMIKAVASDRATNDNFGYHVAISGDLAIIGSPQEDQDADGNNTVSGAGSAYIFERDGLDWVQVQKIVSSDRATGDQFGWSVSISGDIAIIGAYQEDQDANGANTKSGAGSAYIFERNNTGVWSETQKIIASDRASFDFFSYSVSISGDHLIVGAYYEDQDVDGLNTLSTAGSAYIFERNNSGTWIQAQKIVASDRGVGDFFGRSVSISGDYAIVGAYYEDENVSGSNTLSSAGSAYIFERDGTGDWTQKQKIVSGDRAINDFFGISVSISGDYALIGAHYSDKDDETIDAGAAYIFQRDGAGNWNQEQKIVSSDRDTKDYFGKSVSISGNYLVVGANYEDEDLSGNNTLNIAGAAYIFEKDDADNWSQKQKFVASDRAAGDRFGSSVAISGENIVIGAYLEDEDITNGNTSNQSGSAYIFMKEEVLMVTAVKDSDTKVTLTFNTVIQTEEDNPEDFIITDGNGTFFPVLDQTDGAFGDNDIELTVSNLATAVNGLNLYYVNNNNEIKNLSGSAILETNLTGIAIGAAFTTTYTSGAWDNGVPNGSYITIIDDDFVSTANLLCYNLTVNSGKSFHLNGHKAEITSDFVLENGAAFLDEGTLSSGKNIIKRTTSSTSLSQFHLLSSPISNGNVEASFQGSYAYRYIGGEYDNIYAFDNGASIVNGEGLAISGTANGLIDRSFSGDYNKNNIDYNLISTDQWHLLGNPYPTQLDLTALYNANNTTLKPTFYFYNENTGAYDTWNTALDFGTGSATANAAVIQAFFAVELNTSAAQVNYTAAMRTLATDVFLKTAVEENSGKLSLSLDGAETLIAWRADGSDGEDLNDAPYLQGSSTKGLYTLQEDADMTIQSIHNDFDSKVISLGYYHYEGGNSSISLQDISSNGAIELSLIDRYTNTVHDLKETPYEFIADASDLMIDDRFQLVLIKASLAVEEDLLPEGIQIQTGQSLEVLSTNEDAMIEEISITSLNGALIYQKTNINNNRFVWDHNLAGSLYLLSIKTKNTSSHHKIWLP